MTEKANCKQNMRSPNDRLKGMIGLAKKAGRAVSGTELVNDAVRRGKMEHVYISCDASQNTHKRLTNCCLYYKVGYTVTALSSMEIAKAIGRQSPVAAVGITDNNFTAQINKIIEENSECCKADLVSAGGADNDTKSEIQIWAG